MKIAINKCFGGFSPSAFAYEEYMKRKGKKAFFYIQTKYQFRDKVDEYTRTPTKDIDKQMFHCMNKDLGKTTSDLGNRHYVSLRDEKIRVDPDFIKIVEKFGNKVNTQVSDIQIVEIPDGIKWKIDDYDGIETIHEEHRSW